MNGSNRLYSQVVDITGDYLGPASKRFIDRQVVNHLGKEPEDINHEDLDNLIKWIEAATALITQDKKIIREFTGRLQALTNHQRTV